MMERMPVLFVGHGSPMNAIEDNEFSMGWEEIGKSLPKPKAILCISAHWETWGALVTAMEKPRTIHDFGGFPPALYRVRYPAPGSRWLAEAVKSAVTGFEVGYDQDWGLDHGCWSVLKRMFPSAEFPVVQLSLDSTMNPKNHFALGRKLSSLRREGVLIIGSGNMVHNLGRMVLKGDFNEPFGLDWAIEANETLETLINERRHDELIDYPSLGKAVQMAVPTSEHYLPMLYTVALREEGETVAYFNDKPVAGSLTMTSFIIA